MCEATAEVRGRPSHGGQDCVSRRAMGGGIDGRQVHADAGRSVRHGRTRRLSDARPGRLERFHDRLGDAPAGWVTVECRCGVCHTDCRISTAASPPRRERRARARDRRAARRAPGPGAAVSRAASARRAGAVGAPRAATRRCRQPSRRRFATHVQVRHATCARSARCGRARGLAARVVADAVTTPCRRFAAPGFAPATSWSSSAPAGSELSVSAGLGLGAHRWRSIVSAERIETPAHGARGSCWKPQGRAR